MTEPRFIWCKMEATFTDSCKELPEAAHRNCRQRNVGVWFRQSVNPTDPQFECPHGHAWIEDDAPIDENDIETKVMELDRLEKCKDCEASVHEGNGCTLVKLKGCGSPDTCFGKWRRTKNAVCPRGTW